MGCDCVTAVTEKKIEHYLTSKVQAAGGLCWKWPASARAGVPDRIVIIGGEVVFVELKRPGGKLSAIQKAVHAKLRAAGARVEVIDSQELIDNLISAIVTK
jgi:hypothetical protein